MKKQRTAKQIAATKKMIAARKKNLAAKAKTYAENPVKPLAKRSYSRSASPASTSTPKKRKYRRNPIAGVQRGKGMFAENVKPAALGAAAALGFDLVWGRMTFIPTSLRAGMMQYPVKLLGALALGVAAEKFLPQQYKRHATTLVRGPLTVIMHQAGKEFVQKNYPSLGLMAYEEDQLAEILHEQPLNGYYDFDQSQAIETMGENLRLEGLASQPVQDVPFYVPQYDGVAY